VWQGAVLLLRNWRFYVAAAVLLAGIHLNFMSQSYLHAYISHDGRSFPELSDMVLDNIPMLDVDYLSDLASLLASLVFAGFVIHRQRYRDVSLYLVLCGAFHLVRGVFIVLTPFGNPPGFDGTDGLFNGFSKYELGVYPSGHTGIAWMYFVLATDRRYRIVLFGCLVVIVIALFLSRSHYSIDVLSGIFFAYAIKAYGTKYWGFMRIPERPEDETAPGRG
jgi:hypothetical protein